MEFHFSFFAIRIPRYAVSDLIHTIIKSNNGVNNYELFNHFFNKTWVKEALFLASPELLKSLDEASRKGEKPSVEAIKTVWRYIFRMHSRSTPFGLFAGLGIGQINNQTAFELGNQPWRSSSRPDSTVINNISKIIASKSSVYPLLRYKLNNSLYSAVNTLRYSEKTIEAETNKEKIVLSSIDESPVMKRFLYSAISKEQSYEQLVKKAAEIGIGVDVLNTLIKESVLLHSLNYPATGLPIHSYFINELRRTKNNECLQVANQLETITKELNASIDLSALIKAQDQLLELYSNYAIENTDHKCLIQTDSFIYPKTISFSEKRLKSIVSQYTELRVAINSRNIPPLKTFSQKFRNRYDQQEIPLLEALDPDIGLGYNTAAFSNYPLLDYLTGDVGGENISIHSSIDKLRQNLMKQYLLNLSNEVAIHESDLMDLHEHIKLKPLPPVWFLHGEYYEKGDNWNFLVNPSVGTGPAAVLGRFCHDHPELAKEVVAMCQWEQDQYEEDLLVELTHLPTDPASSGNLVARPAFRAYEIPYLSPAAVDTNHEIRLSDLAVQVGPGEEVQLIHIPTRKRVRIRHSSAHNALIGDEVYQFLAHLQQTESNTHFWGWGQFEQMPYLPRVRYKNLIVAPAQWTIDRSFLPKMYSIDDVRSTYKLPRYVQLIEGDNKLFLDLDFEPAQQILLDEVKKKRVLLYEWLAGEYGHWLKDGDDYYEGEIIIPLKNTESIKKDRELSKKTMRQSLFLNESGQTPTPKSVVGRPENNIVRTFLPGDDWFYVKLYCKESMGNTILVDCVTPFVDFAKRKDLVKKFFFIRFDDEHGFHLRLRFLCDSGKSPELFANLNPFIDAYTRNGVIQRVQLDTYVRELERYHPQLIDQTESLFCEDSLMVLDFLQQFESDEATVLQFAMASVKCMFDLFKFTLEQKKVFSQRLQDSLWFDIGHSKSIRKKLNDFYRTCGNEWNEATNMYSDLLNVRSAQIKPIITELLNFFGNDWQELTTYLATINHMNMTRVFMGENKRYEMIVYHFLARHFETVTALSKQPKSNG